MTVDASATLRAELKSLRARYDDGAVSPAVYVVVRNIEADIAWLEYTEQQQQKRDDAS
jgi:hypothetical protein